MTKHRMMRQPAAKVLAGSAAILVILFLSFALLSPVVFGNLTKRYFNRLQAHFPPGAQASLAHNAITSAGLAVGDEEKACLYTASEPSCIRFFRVNAYAGGTVLCNYWLRITATTVSTRTRSRAINTVIEKWEYAPAPASCLWDPGRSGERESAARSIWTELSFR